MSVMRLHVRSLRYICEILSQKALRRVETQMVEEQLEYFQNLTTWIQGGCNAGASKWRQTACSEIPNSWGVSSVRSCTAKPFGDHSTRIGYFAQLLLVPHEAEVRLYS